MKSEKWVDYELEKSRLNSESQGQSYGLWLGLRLAHLLLAGNNTVAEVCSLLSALVAEAKSILVTAVCVCVSVFLPVAAFAHYCTYPDVTWGNGTGCPVVVHYGADLQSVHRFRCYDNIHIITHMQSYSLIHCKCVQRRTRNVSECLYSLYGWLCYSSCIRNFLEQQSDRTYALDHTIQSHQ